MSQKENEANLYQEILIQRGVVQESPESADNHLHLGLLLMESGDYKAALDSMKTATYLDKEHAEAHFNSALCYQQLSLLDSAIAAYEVALNFTPENADIWSNLALIMYQRGNLTNSILYYIKAAGFAPKKPLIWQNLSYVQYAYGKYGDAIKSARNAMMLDKSEENLGQLGLSLYADQQYQESCDALTESLEMNDKQAEIWNCLGNCMTHLDQYQSAQTAFKKAVDMIPDNPDFWFNLSELQIKLEQPEEAINSLKRVININEKDIEALSLLGYLHINNSPSEAIQYFEHYLDFSAPTVKILNQLAILYSEIDYKKEFYHRNQLRKLDAYDLDNNKRLIDLYLKLGSPEKAFELLFSSKNIQYQNVDNLNRLAQYFQFKKVPDKELVCIEKILEIKTDHSPSWQRLGEIALSEGLLEKTITYFQKIEQPFQMPLKKWRYFFRIMIGAENRETTIELLKNILPSVQYAVVFWNTIFKQFRQKKQLDFLIDQLMNAAQLETASAGVLLNLSLLLHQFGKTNEAIALLKSKSSLLKNSSDYYLKLGTYHLELKNNDTAITILIEANEQFPNHQDILLLLSEAYLKQEDRLNAAKIIQLGLDIDEENDMFWMQLGDLELQQHEFKKAITMYERALSFKTTDTVYRKMGLTLMDQGSISDAKVFFKKALMLNKFLSSNNYNYSKILLVEKNYIPAKKYIQFALARNRYTRSYWETAETIFSELKMETQKDRCQQQIKALA